MKGAVIEVKDLQKRFGRTYALRDLSFVAQPGRVAGFLGPNGAGKSTTLRVLLGLMFADVGTATFDGTAYTDLPRPSSKVGALLDDSTFHPGRSGIAHLRIVALAGGLDPAEADRVLEIVDLVGDGHKRVGAYSTGMRQRLALATALLARPATLVLDEPANGLDPAGIRWLRDFLRGFAADGGTVLMSSHVLAEVSQTADDIVLINRGRLVLAEPIGHLLRRMSEGMEVRSPEAAALAHLLEEKGVAVMALDGERLVVREDAVPTLISIAGQNGVPVKEIAQRTKTLEDVFFELTEHPLEAERGAS